MIYLNLFWLTGLFFLAPTGVRPDGVSDYASRTEPSGEHNDPQAQQNYFYDLPNPFKTPALGYYNIESYQTIVSSKKKRSSFYVDEYFSLADGISYSLRVNRQTGSSYAIISDGPLGRSYIVRNPQTELLEDSHTNNKTSDQLDEAINCELDHLHHHRQVFPWMFSFDIETIKKSNGYNSRGRKKNKSRRRSRWANRRFIYGVGAIWLNAIEQKLVSNQIGDNSPYPLSNLWSMRQGDLEIIFLFEKPEVLAKREPREATQRLLDQANLSSIMIYRNKVLESDPEMDGISMTHGTSYEEIKLQKFDPKVDIKQSVTMKRLFSQLESCRRSNKRRRVFPSLLRELNQSPQKFYTIDYLQRKMGLVSDGSSPNAGHYDRLRHRHVRNTELHSEWVSLDKEAQVSVFEGIPEVPDPDNHSHIFMKLFTEKANGHRSSRHTTAEYHLIESDRKLLSCNANEPDQLPIWFSLLIRPIHFLKPGGIRYSGQLTGLGALLMNVADIHYKHFNLFIKNISVAYDATNLAARRTIKVDEWSFLHKSSRRNVHFYFKSPEEDYDNHRISDLVRVDIRDSSNWSDGRSDDAIQSNDDDDLDDPDLLIRYDVLRVELEESHAYLNFVFKKPDICDSINNVTDDESDEQEIVDEDGRYHLIDSDDDENRDGSAADLADQNEDDDEDQSEGENMEFDPGLSIEGAPFPDFYELFQGETDSFCLSSRLDLLPPNRPLEDNQDQTANKFITNQPRAFEHVFLRELFNHKTNLARLSIFFDEHTHRKDEPQLDYYINYNEEVIFQFDRGECRLLREMDTWLRLLSSKVTYYRFDNGRSSMEEGQLIRLYGLNSLLRHAAESEFTDFVGAKRELIMDADGSPKFRELIWSTLKDGDPSFELRFQFWSPIRKDNESVAKLSEAPILKSVYAHELFGDPQYEGSFRKFSLSEPKLEAYDGSLIKLPLQCWKILEDKALAKEDIFNISPHILNFQDFIQGGGAYIAHYTVTMAKRQPSGEKEQKALQAIQYTETYDMELNRGIITIGSGPEMRQIYINGFARTIHLWSQGKCKRISSIKGLVDLDERFFIDDDQFSTKNLHGLAALVIQCGQLRNNVQKSEIHHDKHGNMYQRRTFLVQIPERLTQNTMFNVKIIYTAHQLGLARASDYRLETIDIYPPTLTGTDQESSDWSKFRTLVEIQSLIPTSNLQTWILPDECEIPVNPNIDQSSSQTTSEQWIPSFIGYARQVGFHMRSEILLWSPLLNETKQLFVVDEWIKNERYRMKSYGLKKNFDFLIRANTGFDLSERYKCTNQLQSIGTSSRNLLPEFLLNDDKMIPDSLADLLYSPMALWRLSSNKNLLVNLTNSVELAPKARLDGSELENLEREMGIQTWTVRHPESYWSYTMQFEHNSMAAGGKTSMEWYQLDRITAIDADRSNSFNPIQREIDIDIINYRCKSDLKEQFLLPEGYGCQPKASDNYTIAWNLNNFQVYLIWYEASLQLVSRTEEDSEIGEVKTNSRILPTVMGTFVHSSHLEPPPYQDVSVHYSTIRFLNGDKKSTRLVTDLKNGLTFRMDRLNGHCLVEHPSSSDWFIEFHNDAQLVHTIQVDDLLFETLFINSNNTYLINRFKDINNKFVSVFELSLDWLRLDNQIEGPARIIRRVESYKIDAQESDIESPKFAAISVKVIIFDEQLSSIKALLNLNLKKTLSVPVEKLFESMNVGDCYDTGQFTTATSSYQRNFVIEYHCSDSLADTSKLDSVKVLSTFAKALSQNSGLMATQFSGYPKLEIKSSGLLRFTFSLLDPPSIMQHNSVFKAFTGMSPEMELRSESRLSESIAKCSSWCDQVNCVVMSYCLDRICRIVTTDMLHDSPNQAISEQDIEFMSNTVWRSDCEYMYRTDPRPATIDRFYSKFDESINQRGQMVELLLGTEDYCHLVSPIRIYEISDELDISRSDITTGSSDETFIILKKNSKISTTKLQDIPSNYEGSVEHAYVYQKCLEACLTRNCSVVSFCKKPVSECIILKGAGDLNKLNDMIEPTDSNYGCAVSTIDILESYSMFDNVQIPHNPKMKLYNYTAIECGSKCSVTMGRDPDDFKCLSFDFCTDQAKPDEPESKGICYLNEMHVMMDTFDQKLFLPNSSSFGINALGDHSKDEQQLICRHYSKTILADYEKISNLKSNIAHSHQVRGRNAEKCALDCQLDDGCFAFDNCFNDNQRPATSCRFFRTNISTNADDINELFDQLKTKSTFSNECSTYLRNFVAEEYTISQDTFVILFDHMKDNFDKGASVLGFISNKIYYALGSLAFGLSIQMAYIKLCGRPINFGGLRD